MNAAARTRLLDGARHGALALLTLFGALAGAAQAATLTEHMAITCTQAQPLTLHCDYRLRDGGTLEAATAEWQGQTAAATLGAAFPQPGAQTVILILVDTSDPARQPAVERAITHIERLLDEPGEHRRFGLASFDSDLFMLAPPGSPREDVRRAARQLVARGKTTELFRNVRDAVRVLARETAARKALLVISDGLAEDYAYGHADVVALARDNDIIISGIGLPRSVGQSVALQTLRRLADETGGSYIQADHLAFDLPPEALPHWLATLDAGGQFDLALQPFVEAGAAGTTELSLALQTPRQNVIVLVPVVLPVATATATAAPASGTTPPADARPQAPPPPPPPLAAPTPWLFYLGVLGALLGMLGLLVFFLQRIRREVAAAGAEAPRPALAWLIAEEAPQRRHVIDKTPWRIGRSRSADLTLNDHSVSRLHAEIRGSEDGGLSLHDLESLNGVFVNDNRISSVQLREGDTVDIGDVRLRFTLHDENYASQDATVLVRTRTPF